MCFDSSGPTPKCILVPYHGLTDEHVGVQCQSCRGMF